MCKRSMKPKYQLPYVKKKFIFSQFLHFISLNERNHVVSSCQTRAYLYCTDLFCNVHCNNYMVIAYFWLLIKKRPKPPKRGAYFHIITAATMLFKMSIISVYFIPNLNHRLSTTSQTKGIIYVAEQGYFFVFGDEACRLIGIKM